jgi:hypothetical protein
MCLSALNIKTYDGNYIDLFCNIKVNAWKRSMYDM